MEAVLINDKCSAHPVDLIEKVASDHNWQFERIAKDELSVTIEGVFANYKISFSWLDDFEALHVACAFPVTISKRRRNDLDGLLLQINEKMLIGHFDYWPNAQLIIYRQALLLPGGLYPSNEQVEMLLMHSLEACESHFPSFEVVSNSKTSATQALRYALFETVGNA